MTDTSSIRAQSEDALGSRCAVPSDSMSCIEMLSELVFVLMMSQPVDENCVVEILTALSKYA